MTVSQRIQQPIQECIASSGVAISTSECFSAITASDPNFVAFVRFCSKIALTIHVAIPSLSEVVAADAIPAWLDAPNEAFDGLKPLEVIERGEIDRLWNMVFYLEAGVAS
jgi:hypothetical protein